jgi:hypothetical protein
MKPLMSHKLLKNLFYLVIVFIVTPLLYFVAVGALRLTLGGDGQNKVLEVNVQLIVAAFALVVTVALVVAQLASTMGIGRTILPKWYVLLAELLTFAVAISVTLLGRWLGPGLRKDVLTHASSFLTLAGLLCLIPYFWYVRQQISTHAVIKDAITRCKKHASGRGPAILDVLLGAARKGDYLLFRDGVDYLSKSAASGAACRKYLEQLEQHLRDDSGNGHALEIVTTALTQLQPPDVQTPASGT